MKRYLAVLPLLLILAACQPQAGSPLDVPTLESPSTATTEPSATATAPTPEPSATVPLATAPAGEAPTAATATATLPIPIVATKPTKPGSATPAIILPPPIDEPVIESAGGHQVAFVAFGDTLNVRSGPGADFPVVGELAPDASGLVVDEATQSLVEGSTWVYVVGPEGVSGYVNSRFLTEAVPPSEYCNDPAMNAVLASLREAIANRDGAQLAELVHPERGLRLRQSWWNEEILVPAEDVAGLFSDASVYDWGTEDGSGLPISGPFSEVILPLLDKDLVPAQTSACAEMLAGPTAGLVTLPEGYGAIPFTSFFRSSPDVAFDWGTWIVGVERWEGRYYLSYLVHYAYEI